MILLNSFLLWLFPWALITGPFLPDLIVSLSGFVFLVGSLYRRRWQCYQTAWFGPLDCFMPIFLFEALSQWMLGCP